MKLQKSKSPPWITDAWSSGPRFLLFFMVFVNHVFGLIYALGYFNPARTDTSTLKMVPASPDTVGCVQHR